MSDDTGFNLFQCALCTDRPEFSPSEFGAHLKETHGYIDTSGQKRMIRHLDAEDWFQTDYEWSKDGKIIAYQGVRCARRGANRDQWATPGRSKKGKQR